MLAIIAEDRPKAGSACPRMVWTDNVDTRASDICCIVERLVTVTSKVTTLKARALLTEWWPAMRREVVPTLVL